MKTIKTAGSSIELALQKALLPGASLKQNESFDGETGIVGARGSNPQQHKYWNHMTAKAVYDALGYDRFNGYCRVSAIRNPFDKVVSWFFFGFHKTVNFSEDRAAFNAFVSAASRLPVDRKIYTIGGAICCESFVRFEHLQKDVDALITRLTGGAQTKLSLGAEKSGNRDRNIRFQDYYEPAAKDAVKRAFEFEFENFSYDFEGDG